MTDKSKNLPTTYHQGYCYFDVNTGKFWIDTTNTAAGRMAINAANADSVEWNNVNNKPSSFYTLPVASDNTLGGIKTGYQATTGSKVYPVQLSADGKAFVTVEWDDNVWQANTVTQDGYVTKGQGNANKVWKTDSSGVPAWRDDANTIYTLPIATSTKLGGIKAGSGNDGENRYSLQVDASTAVGYVLIPNATKSTIGLVKIGDGININNGVISVTAENLGLSRAFNFIGITSTSLEDGATTSTLVAKSTGSLSKTTGFVAGDVVIDKNNAYEYVWTGNAWERLGPDSMPIATESILGGIKVGYQPGNGTKVYPVQLSAEGKAFVSVEWTDTQVTSVENHYLPTTNEASKLTVPPANPSAGDIGAYTVNTEYTVLTEVTAQRDAKGHITSLAYKAQKIKDTNNFITEVKVAENSSTTSIVLTRNDNTTISGVLPKVSSNNSGIVPKGSTVTSQSKTTKFLREDGTWAAPSYSKWSDLEGKPDVLYKNDDFTGNKILISNGTEGEVKEGTFATQNVIKTITFSGGTTPTLGTEISADDITSWNAGSTPTLGTAFSVPNVTDNTDVTASKVTKEDVTVVTNISQADSTSSVIATVDDGVLTITKAITAVGAVTKSTGTANTVTISDVSASKVTLGTAFSIPNVTNVGTKPSLSYTARSIPNVTSVGSIATLTETKQSVVTGIS